MNKKVRVYTDPQFTADVFFIEERADAGREDALLMLGLLAHIMARRRWYGTQKDWADIPVNHMSEHYGVGFRRIKEALDKLEAWGIIEASPSNSKAKQWHKSLAYRYPLRQGAREGSDLEVPDEVEETPKVAEVKPVRQEARRTPVATPPVKYPIYSPIKEGSFLYTDTVWGQYQKNLVSKDIYDATPTCQQCGRKVTYFKSGEVCRDCWTADWIRNTMRNGGFPITVTEEVLKNKRTHPAATLNTVALARQWLAAYQQGLDSKT